MQAKDIPVLAVLRSINRHDQSAGIFTLWRDDFPSVPFKVLKAKMDKLRKQDIVDSCCNECNSYISLRQRGVQLLTEAICDVCNVDHNTSMADLSHGIIRLLEHSLEQMPWMEFPISGDNFARQRAGINSPSLLFSVHWDEDDFEEKELEL